MTSCFAFGYIGSLRRPLLAGAAAVALCVAAAAAGAVMSAPSYAAMPNQGEISIQQDQQGAQVSFSADDFRESALLETLRFTGHVDLSYQGWRLQAYQLGYNGRTKKVIASGTDEQGVRITDPNGQTVTQRAYILDGALREGFFAGLVAYAQPGSYAETVLNPDVVDEGTDFGQQDFIINNGSDMQGNSHTGDVIGETAAPDKIPHTDSLLDTPGRQATHTPPVQNLLEAPEVPVSVVQEEYFPLSADYYAEYGILNRLRLKGDVIINYNDWALRADQLSYDTKLDRITVSGNVKVKQPDGHIISQHARVLEGVLRDGFFYGLKQFAEPGSMAYDIVQKHDVPAPDRPQSMKGAALDQKAKTPDVTDTGVVVEGGQALNLEKQNVPTYITAKAKAAQSYRGAKILKADSYTPSEIFRNLRFKGDVVIEFGGWKLVADQLTYSTNTNRLTALGHVSVIEPDGSVFDSHAYVVEGKLREGFFEGLYEYAQPGSFAMQILAQDAEILKGDLMVADGAPDVSKDGSVGSLSAENVLSAKGKDVQTLKGLIVVSDPNLVGEQFLADAMINYVLPDDRTTPVLTYGIDFDDHVFEDRLHDHYVERPITMGLLDNLVKEVKARNEEQGWPFTTVYVPEQSVEDGVVFLVAQRAALDSVTVSGNKYYTDGQILAEVRQKAGEPLRSDRWSEDLGWLNKSSYRAVTARFEPGKTAGTTHADLHVNDVKPWRVYVTRNNNGTPSLGEQQLAVGVTHGNLWRKDHEFAYQYLVAEVNQNLQAHSLRYRAPLPWRHYASLDASYSRSHARFLNDAFESEGASRQVSGRYEIPLDDHAGDRWAFTNQMVKMGLDYKHSEGNIFFTLFGGDPIDVGAGTNVELLHAAASYEGQIDDPWGGYNDVRAEVYMSPGGILGSNKGDDFDRAREGAKSSYVYGRLALDRSVDMLLPFYDDPFTLDTDMRLQASSGRLVGSEQMTTGGFAQIRGYHTSAFAGDYGYSTSLEFNSPNFNLFPSYMEDILQVGAFVDFGTLGILSPRDGEEKFNHLLTSGLELKYQVNSNFMASLVYAQDLAAQDQDDLQDLKFNVTLSY